MRPSRRSADNAAAATAAAAAAQYYIIKIYAPWVKCSMQKNVSDTIKISTRETSFTTQRTRARAREQRRRFYFYIILCFSHTHTRSLSTRERRRLPPSLYRMNVKAKIDNDIFLGILQNHINSRKRPSVFCRVVEGKHCKSGTFSFKQSPKRMR